jgi:MFS family permease
MNKFYRIINNSTGWLMGIVASAVYILTAEPTFSWWDCGEYIATAHKLLVGHPPGAPTFQIIGCVFSLLAGNDPAMVGFWVNVMSALCSGFGIMFLFWTITLFGKKLVNKMGGFTPVRTIAVFAAGLVGALTYTFTDSYWFSAVEGEVYSMSSFFTALVFWCILKWDEEYDNPKPHTNPQRWLILIFYLIGLSIGVHLLNLLTIPAIGLIIYYKLSKNASYKGTLLAIAFIAFGLSILCNVGWMLGIWAFIIAPLIYVSFKNGALRSKAEWGVIGSLGASVAVMGLILWGVIPGIVSWAGKVEIFCKNSLSLPFNTGTVIYFLFIFGAIGYAIYYGYKKKKQLLKISAYSLLFLLIGYSTFLTLVIRSNADPTIDENSPEDAVSLLSYLNREQYGATPLIYGQSYNSRFTYEDGAPVYVRDDKAGKYVITKYSTVLKYNSNDQMFFPRMWDHSEDKKRGYIDWLKTHVYNSGSISDKENIKSLEKGNLPTMEQNKDFLHSHQIQYMYWRYFMWNFVGRQTELQGRGDYDNGNWVSGIPLIDNKRVGKYNELPITMERKGHNTYFFLPLILGIMGLIYYSRKDLNNSFVVFLLFFMTGWAIAFYLNNAAFQPRERDYAYAASFYAFSIWVGFGAFALIALLEKWKNEKGKIAAAILISLICLGLVPGIMGMENWDDHDRSNRYQALSFAKNYLDSCEPNAIFFTMGDNETFPLWYAQEVEGYRTDVRVCNLSLLNGSWYIDQMKRKAYNSEPLPISMTWNQYKDGTRDQIVLNTAGSQFLNIKEVIDYIKDARFDNKAAFALLPANQGYRTDGANIPASFHIPVDKEKVLTNGTVLLKDADLIVDKITWNRNTNKINYIQKTNLMMMDILANFNWDRPLYFSISSGPEAYFGLEEYFQLEGMAYRLVPIKSKAGRGYTDAGRINTTSLPDKLLNVFPNHARVDTVNNPDRKQKPVYPFLWGGINDKRVFSPEETSRMFPTIKAIYLRTAEQLVAEGNIEKAEQLYDKLLEIFDSNVIPYILVGNRGHSIYSIDQADALFKLGTKTATEKALKMAEQMFEELKVTFDWFEKCDERTMAIQNDNFNLCVALFSNLNKILSDEQQLLFQEKYEQIKITKSLTLSASQLGAEIDYYFKKGTDGQRDMFEKFRQLSQLGDIAEVTHDNTLQMNIYRIIEAKVDMLTAADAQLGRMFRNYFLPEETE